MPRRRYEGPPREGLGAIARALTAIGERGKPVLTLMDSVAQAMFRYTHYVMYFAPVGVCAAMARRPRSPPWILG